MKARYLILALLLAASGLSISAYCLAGDTWGHDEHRKESRGKRQRHGRAESQAEPTRSAAYEAACGSCHWAYAPQLLPRKSWEHLIATLGGHFGSDVSLSEQEKRAVAEHLLNNAADASPSRLSRRVMHSLGGTVPARIVEVPYIQHKHRKLAPAVFARKGVGGMANCVACHPGAGRLDFEDDRVRIPEK